MQTWNKRLLYVTSLPKCWWTAVYKTNLTEPLLWYLPQSKTVVSWGSEISDGTNMTKRERGGIYLYNSSSHSTLTPNMSDTKKNNIVLYNDHHLKAFMNIMRLILKITEAIHLVWLSLISIFFLTKPILCTDLTVLAMLVEGYHQSNGNQPNFLLCWPLEGALVRNGSYTWLSETTRQHIDMIIHSNKGPTNKHIYDSIMYM